MITVIEAPNSYNLSGNEFTLFLAGGIVNCPDWRSVVIQKLYAYDKKHPLSLTNLTVFNPRRKNFPIKDKSATRKQIEWEFRAIENSDIFSMWFCNSSSDQPICMYELGRELGRNLGEDDINIIGVESGYKREQDVYIQTNLATDNSIKISKTLDGHVKKIILAYKELQKCS